MEEVEEAETRTWTWTWTWVGELILDGGRRGGLPAPIPIHCSNPAVPKWY